MLYIIIIYSTANKIPVFFHVILLSVLFFSTPSLPFTCVMLNIELSWSGLTGVATFTAGILYGNWFMINSLVVPVDKVKKVLMIIIS